MEQLAQSVRLDDPTNERLRLAFGYACASRVRHLLETHAVVQCLEVLERYLEGSMERALLDTAAAQARQLANQHQGSQSLDGCGHAAVSATYAVANALSGKALQAAEYAAYAAVYGQGGHGAVAEPESFEPEFQWQLDQLDALTRRVELHPAR